MALCELPITNVRLKIIEATQGHSPKSTVRALEEQDLAAGR